MSNLKRRLDALYQRKVVKVLEERVMTVSLDLLGTLKVNTPVDTGRARSNWHLDTGAPTISIVEPGADKPADLVGYSIGKRVFISNNLSYIRPLDEGHSQQAPNGFVRDSIAEVKARARRRTK